MISIVTGATIGNAQAMVATGGPVQVHFLSLFTVTVNAPAHVKFAGNFHFVHFRDVAVALGAIKSTGDVHFV